MTKFFNILMFGVVTAVMPGMVCAKLTKVYGKRFAIFATAISMIATATAYGFWFAQLSDKTSNLIPFMGAALTMNGFFGLCFLCSGFQEKTEKTTSV